MASAGSMPRIWRDMIAEIRQLDPKPGAAFDTAPPQPLVPDVLMRPAPDGGWMLELNPETMPRVLVNQRFYARVAPRAARGGSRVHGRAAANRQLAGASRCSSGRRPS